MNDRITGLIISQTDYRDHAALVNILSRDYGRLTLRAEGVRKITSKSAGSLITCTKGEFSLDYVPGKTIFRLKGVRTLSAYRKVHSDLVLSAAAGVLAECADVMTYCGQDAENAGETAGLLEEALDLLEGGARPDIVLALFVSSVMELNGLSPNVDECVLCGKKNAASISIRDGGFLCSECTAKAGLSPRSITDLRRFRLVCKAGLQHYGVIEEKAGNTDTELKTLIEMIRLHAGASVRSFSFYESVSH